MKLSVQEEKNILEKFDNDIRLNGIKIAETYLNFNFNLFKNNVITGEKFLEIENLLIAHMNIVYDVKITLMGYGIKKNEILEEYMLVRNKDLKEKFINNYSKIYDLYSSLPNYSYIKDIPKDMNLLFILLKGPEKDNSNNQ